MKKWQNAEILELNISETECNDKGNGKGNGRGHREHGKGNGYGHNKNHMPGQILLPDSYIDFNDDVDSES